MKSRRFKWAVLVAAVVTAGCSGDAPPPQAAGEGGIGGTKAAAPPPVCIDGTGAQGGRIDRPAVALKIVSRAHGFESFVSLQPQYSLVERNLEYELMPVCLDQGIGILPWGCLLYTSDAA